MNKVILMGRLTRDPEVRYSQGEKSTAIAKFSLAVNRKFKNSDGNYDADFPNCTAMGKTAEFIEKYFKKGMLMAVVGRIQTGSYTNKDGVKVYTTDVFIEECEFAESKATSQQNNGVSQPQRPSSDGFMSIPDGIEDELPFQ